MKALLFFVISLPLLLFCGIISHAACKLNFNEHSLTHNALIGGFLSGCLIFSLISRFTRLYVFGHELAHWIFAKIFLRETRNFKAASDHGAVEIQNPNIWIALAPYFYPTFTVLWIPSWFIFRHFSEHIPYPNEIYFAVLSFSWSYHFILTIYALRREQSDITRYGKPLSFSLITLINLIVCYCFLSLFTPSSADSLKLVISTATEDYNYLTQMTFTFLEMGNKQVDSPKKFVIYSNARHLSVSNQQNPPCHFTDLLYH